MLLIINYIIENTEINFESTGVVSSYDKKGISILKTQPLNLYIIHKNKLKVNISNNKIFVNLKIKLTIMYSSSSIIYKL